MLFSGTDTSAVSEASGTVRFHNVCGVILTASYLIFFLGNIFTPNGKHYMASLKGKWKNIRMQASYYRSGYSKGEPSPFIVDGEHKFNPLQQLTYFIIMYVVVPLIFLTGWALMFPEFILKKILGFKEVFFASHFHVLMGILVVIFLFIHIYISTFGKTRTSNFRSIISGWQEV